MMICLSPLYSLYTLVSTACQRYRPGGVTLFVPLFQIVGIITRHNLTHEFLLAKLRQHYITI